MYVCIYIYIYTYIHMCVCVCIYIYICREREVPLFSVLPPPRIWRKHPLFTNLKITHL